MTTIHVTASRDYDVLVQPGLLDDAGAQIAQVLGTGRTAAIVSGETVAGLYAARLAASLTRAGFRAVTFPYPGGEHCKTLATYAALLDFLAAHRLSRSDLIVALGGGVTGDLAGFAAATYQRGIPFVQVPTTLLAAVDSSVGGKTAVNLVSGKNQVGCFYQPSLVLCDPDTLRTLPPEEYRNGCAEVIKYAVLRSEPFFSELRAAPVSAQVEHVIATCVGMKRDLVAADEFDRGSRQLLNLGHSFGHAVEKCSDYAVPHGCGVAIGMAIIARAAAKRGICTEDTCAQIIALLRQYGLPTETDEDVLGIAELANQVLHTWRMHATNKARGVRITVSTSCFVPKPHSPFQWEAQVTMDEYKRKVNLLRENIKAKNVTYNWHDPDTSFIEAVLSRGDRRIADVIEEVWRRGGKLEAWGDYFSFDRWMAAMDACGVDPMFYACRERGKDEFLPWDIVDMGVRRAHLWHEREQAYKAELSPDCRKQCTGCGALALMTEGGKCDA